MSTTVSRSGVTVGSIRTVSYDGKVVLKEEAAGGWEIMGYRHNADGLRVIYCAIGRLLQDVDEATGN